MFSKFIFVALFAFVSTLGLAKAFADEASTEAPAGAMGPLPLNIGHVEVGGSASYTKNVRTNSRYLSISPKAEYFFFNRFSAGGTVVYSDYAVNGASATEIAIGPSATYYITHTERTAISVDQSVLWDSMTNADNYVRGTTGLAFDYFFSPSIAFGPEVRGVYYFNGGLNKPDDAVQLLFNFSMFL